MSQQCTTYNHHFIQYAFALVQGKILEQKIKTSNTSSRLKSILLVDILNIYKTKKDNPVSISKLWMFTRKGAMFTAHKFPNICLRFQEIDVSFEYPTCTRTLD